MKIIEPKVEYWVQNDPVEHVAKCARICYGKKTGNDNLTVANLLRRKHLSMFRHESVYYILPRHKTTANIFTRFNKCPYIDHISYGDKIFVVTNGQFIRENDIFAFYDKYKVDASTFSSYQQGFELMRYTFKITTQISTSRELNRVSPNNIAEKSTRYVYENGSICKPYWFDNTAMFEYEFLKYTYLNQCEEAFKAYKQLIDRGYLHRQDARGVLPLDTATECIYTYTIKEWRNIINLRYYGTTGIPHPNAKIIAGLIREQLIELGYDFD